MDSHAHLNDEQFAADAGPVIERAQGLGVSAIVNVAFSRRMWAQTIELSQRFSGVVFTLGVHPNNADEWSESTRNLLVGSLRSHHPVAIGETGLDYYRDHISRSVQQAAFTEQLDLAEEFGLPVIIHMRGEVEADIRRLLDKRTGLVAVFHSFDGTQDLCNWIVERGWYIGAGGLMSRRSAKFLREVLQTVPLERLLLETDSPYLAPTGWTLKRNSPESIPIIAGHMARLLDLTVDDVARRTTENALRVFGSSLAEAATSPSHSV